MKMSPEEFDLHRRIDIARSKVILSARNIIGWWRAEGSMPNFALKDCAQAIDELDKVQEEFTNPVDNCQSGGKS